MSPLALLLGLALQVAEPADEFVAVPCSFLPAFFEVGSARMVGYSADHFGSGYLIDFEVFAPGSRAHVTLMGIATDAGSEAGNRRLARRRAEVVRNYLVRRGVDRERIRIVTRHAALEQWTLDLTHGRAVVIDVRIPRADLFRIMPPGGPIC
ncbi:MAG TPA: OmpA family protein [Allosphingosinicella sp.]|jgi:hypothetical protein